MVLGRERWRFGRRLTVCILAGLVVVSLLILPGAWAHSADAIDAEWASVVPSIDGAMSPGEWADAATVDLGAIAGNRLPSYLLVKNNDTLLWVAYDATGDLTASSNDTASFALDTGHDGVTTDGREDQFLVGGYVGGSAHLVFESNVTYWLTHDSPFDPGLPNHAGLAGAFGFGPSDGSAVDHRAYEFQIPLALLGAASGDTLGLFGGSQPAPGVTDFGTYDYSTWPRYVTSPIGLSEYGDLNLAVPPGPVGVSISPSSASRLGSPSTTVEYSLTVRNRGTAGGDTFDLTSLSTWTVGLWDAPGVNPLVDTDGDAAPDTGNLSSGASVTILVRVDIPLSANGCDVATIIATSSVNTAFWDTSTLTTCTGPASFASPHTDFGFDSDGDLLYNYLEVDARVSVSTTGYYFVEGTLYSGDGSVYIDETYWSFYSGSGTVIAPLLYDGRRIFATGLDGPHRVELNLFDDLGRLIDTDVHATGPYAVTSFDPPPARFAPPHADMGVDDDLPPNGMHDRLLLRASLQVDESRSYYISTSVYDSLGSYVTSGGTSLWLDPGTRIVDIDHRGIDFYRASGDGPYTIEMFLYDGIGFLDNDTHIAAYTRTDFDPPPISFAPPHSDRGQDVDVPPDRLYDFLVVSASVSVAEVGDFRVSGYLYGPGGWPPLDGDDVTVSLTPGSATVDLRFSGPAIQREGRSGNFEVELSAQKEGDFNVTDYDRYATGFYDFSEFQPPPALFAPPHGDRAVDVSVPPDGYDDYLVIDASVDVRRAGRFTVEAYVIDAFGRFLGRTRGSADLDLGPGSIPVRIDGHRIWEQLPAMPLYAYMELYDENDNVLDFNSHATGFYNSYGFQPLDADEPSSAASVPGTYQRSVAPIQVGFAASDPTPSDGIASVSLHYRHSSNNGTWSPWAQYGAQAGSVGQSQLAGTFLFDLPQGDGYYEFYTVAMDYRGNEEVRPATSDASFAVFVPVRVHVSTGATSMSAGGALDVTARAMSATGQPVTLEASIELTLLTTSAAGTFSDAGGNPVTRIAIPAGASEVTLEYTDTRAGDATLSAFASGLESGDAAISIAPGPTVDLALSPPSAGVTVASSITFTATARDVYGNAIPNAPLSWSVQGNVGTITSGGRFTATTQVGPGSVTVESSGLTATAPIVLSPGPANRVEVFATNYGVAPGDTATARALAFDEYGNVVPGTTFTWAVQGPGTLSGTTGDEVTVLATGAGTIRVTATAGSLEGTIEVVARTPEGPAPVAPVGVGGAIGGLVAGLGIGWYLSRKRKAPTEETSPPPKAEEPGPPK